MIRRLFNVIRGWFGLGVSKLEGASPEAMLDLEKENLRRQIAKFNQGLAAHAGLCEKLMSQIKRMESQEKDLHNKARANLRAGNKELAGQYALRLQQLRADLEDNREQLEAAEATYKELVRARDVSIKAARDKIEGLRRSIDDLKVQEAQAELAEMASGMITSIGSSGDTLDRMERMVEEKRTQAAGTARVARDAIDSTEIDIQGIERDALADQALADFAAAEGITLEAENPPPAPAAPETEVEVEAPKSMGPTETE